MMRHIIIATSFMMLMTSTAMAADVIVYPSGGQSQEQQDKDENTCRNWATDHTGFDPSAPREATSAPPPVQEPTSSAGKGALHGALGGLVVGAITGHPGRGAAIGAGTGALVGGVRHNNQVEYSQAQQDAWARQQAAEYEQSLNEFNRAYATCMQGNGYTVN